MKVTTKQRCDWDVLVRKLTLEKKRQFAAFAAKQVSHIADDASAYAAATASAAADHAAAAATASVEDYSAADYSYELDTSVAFFTAAAAESAIIAAYAVADSDSDAAEMKNAILNYGISLMDK